MIRKWSWGERRKGRFAIGLLLAPYTLLTLMLFFSGKRPVPADALVSLGVNWGVSQIGRKWSTIKTTTRLDSCA